MAAICTGWDFAMLLYTTLWVEERIDEGETASMDVFMYKA